MTREETSWYESVIISWLAQQYSKEKMGQAESFKKWYDPGHEDFFEWTIVYHICHIYVFFLDEYALREFLSFASS